MSNLPIPSRTPVLVTQAHASRRTRTHERGQAAVLISLGLFCLVVFTALATNLGILVNEKVRIQNTADLAAYSGAYQQGVRLNAIAGLNKAVQNVVYYCRERLTGKQGRFGTVKVWNQCMKESRPPRPDEYEMFPFELLQQIGAMPPLHQLYPPPFAMSGYPIPAESDQCKSEWDVRANDLLEWCVNTVNYYGQLIYDLNDYDMAYYGKNTLGMTRSIRGYSRKGIFRAVQQTAKANYPEAGVEMLDKPQFSPVFPAFAQTGVESPEVEAVLMNPVLEYLRPSRPPAMAPIVKYSTRMNYVFRCCRIKQQTQPCGPPQCGFPRGVVLPYVGPVNDAIEPRMAYIEFPTIGSYNTGKGMLYMPVRVWGNPNKHDLPILDLPGRTADTNYFGGQKSWNVMRAVAVAKPFEGFVGPTFSMLEDAGLNNEFYPPIINIGSQVEGRPILNGVYTADSLEDLQNAGEHAYPEYRARMAGFREPLLSRSANPQNEDTQKIGKTMLDVLISHSNMQTIPGDENGSDYQNTSH